MKYDCREEFDLELIYKKLTSTSQPPMVKASDFFTPQTNMLALLQKKFERQNMLCKK